MCFVRFFLGEIFWGHFLGVIFWVNIFDLFGSAHVLAHWHDETRDRCRAGKETPATSSLTRTR